MTRSTLVAASLLCSLYCSAASLPASVSRYAGQWDLIPAESDRIDNAIDATVAPMNFLARPVARLKLKRRNVAFPHFRIETSDRGVRVKHEQGLDVSYPSAGATVSTVAPDGSEVIASIEVDPVLALTYLAEGAKREDRYLLNADGSKLTLAVQLTSEKLPKPLSYRLVYRRSPQ